MPVTMNVIRNFDICDRKEIRPSKDILCFKDISEKRAKFGYLISVLSIVPPKKMQKLYDLSLD